MTADERWQRLRAGADPVLRDELVAEHLPLCKLHVRRFRGRGADAEDLEQVAALALLKAIDRFDPDLGVEFATYSSRTIEGELKRHLRDHGWSVRPPRRTQELVLQVRKAEEELRQEQGRAPTIDEIARRAGCSAEAVIEAREAAPARRSHSLDAPAPQSEPPAASAQPAGHDLGFHRVEVRLTIDALLADLDPTDRRIIEARFFEGRSQEEIAAETGVSQSYLSRVLRRILRELREQLEPSSSDGESPPG